MKNNIVFWLLSVIFISGCGGQTDATETVNSMQFSEFSLTEDSKYTKQGISDRAGLLDITADLVNGGYVSGSVASDYVIEIKDVSENPLANMNIAYWLDKTADKINLRIEDPSGELVTLYQQESLSEALSDASKNTKASFAPLVIRVLSVIIRGNSIRNLANSALTGYQLFNIYTEFQEIKEELIYTGSIADFYPVFAQLVTIRKLPFVLKSNTKRSEGLITATGLIRFSASDINLTLLEYLRQITANENLDESSSITLSTLAIDGVQEMVTVELEDGNDIDTASGSFFDIALNVNGHQDHYFDGTLFSVAPELRVVINIGQLSYNALSGETGYSAQTVLNNVPLKQGDEVEVIVYDDDTMLATHLEEVNRFTFVFDGTSQLSENDTSTTILAFTPLNIDLQPDNTPTYNIDLTIEGDENQNPDEGRTLPDFSGEIYVSGRRYVIDKKNNSLTNSKTFSDVPIKSGESIRVTIVEEDVLWPPKVISKFRFNFDGNGHVEENEKARVSVSF